MKNQILRIDKVVEKTGLSPSTIKRLEKKGLFPKRRRISQKAIGWFAEEVEHWINQLKKQA